MAKLFNLAQMTTATAGTGTITLGSAVAPFITFAAAGVQNNDVVAYSIIDGANSEMGYGTYSAVGPTLTRVLRKSSTGALLNLSGSAVVRLTPGREDIINSDGSIAFVANLDMGSNNIINVTDPSNAQDAATKNYVDNSFSGFTGTHNPVTLGTANGLVLSNQVLSLDLASSTSTGSVSAADWMTFNNKQAALGFTPENVANKTQLVRSSGTSSTLYPSESAVSGFVASSIANIPAAGGNIGSFLLSGGGVTWVTGYQFRVSAAQYYIQGVLYSSAEQLITLTGSDGTFDRIDVIVVNTSGQVDKVTGIATSSPSEPDIDPATQLQLAFIIVYASSTSPIINSQTIYSEKAGSPTEWNWSSTGSTWNLASTNNPFAGTKDIEATALGANAYAQGMATGTANLGIYTQLNFYVRSKATWNAGRGLYVAWYSNGVRKGNNVFLAHGFFNFNSDNTTDYQLISIPISQFAVPNGTTVNQLRFTRVGGAIGFYLDEIVVTDSGLTSTPVGLTQEQADARYIRKSSLPWFVVKDYGAIGDGVVDDTASINKAIAALNSAGRGILYFPAGSYKCTSGLTVITAECTILGDGMNAWDNSRTGSEVVCTSGTAVLFSMNTMSAKFQNISLRNSAVSVTAGAGISVTNAAVGPKVDYESLHVWGFYIGVDVQVGAQWVMHNCFVVAPILYAVKIRNTVNVDAGDWSISDSNFYSQGTDADAGIRIESSGGGKIVNCKINMGTDAKKFNHGIDLETATQSSILFIVNTSIENIRGDGFHLVTTGTGEWDLISFTNTQFGLYSNSTGNAINMSCGTLGGVNAVTIEGCTFAGGTSAAAISLTKINIARIVGCAMMPTTFTALLATSGCTNIYESPVTAIGTYTDNAITRFDGTAGDVLQNSAVTIDDNGTVNIPTGQTYNINGSPHTHASSGGYSEGTSFPSGTSTNDKYYRTDRNLLYYYDGTRWLTVEEFSQVLGNLDVLQPIGNSPGNSVWGVTDLGDNGQWVTRISVVDFVATTNSGSHYWTSQLTSRTTAGVAHNIGSTWNTSADTNDQFAKHTTVVGAAVTAGDTHFLIIQTKTGTPGNMYNMATVYYRLIG